MSQTLIRCSECGSFLVTTVIASETESKTAEVTCRECGFIESRQYYYLVLTRREIKEFLTRFKTRKQSETIVLRHVADSTYKGQLTEVNSNVR